MKSRSCTQYTESILIRRHDMKRNALPAIIGMCAALFMGCELRDLTFNDTPINHPPYAPSNCSPSNGATNQPIFIQLGWTGGDADTGDIVTYDVYCDTICPPLIKVFCLSHLAGDTIIYSPFIRFPYGTTFYWYVAATDGKAVAQGDVWHFTSKGSKQKLIPAATFLLGADSASQTAGTVNYWGDTVHQVTISEFYIDTTEVIQAEFLALMGCNPSYFRDAEDWALRPVEMVTWYDAALYCNARSRSEGLDTVYSYRYVDGTPGNGCMGLLNLAIDYSKKGYRLPTEAEWEYACKGGTMTMYWWGNDTAGMGECAWTFFNCNSTHPVATRAANAYGLYDMAGNVFEWCNDWYGSYGSGAATNPTGSASGRNRVLRGGSWYGYLYRVCSANRFELNPDARYSNYGFRCVLPK